MANMEAPVDDGQFPVHYNIDCGQLVTMMVVVPCEDDNDDQVIVIIMISYRVSMQW